MAEDGFVKVCVKVPRNKVTMAKALAYKWRLEARGDMGLADEDEAENEFGREPGWDAKVIHGIARENYGGLAKMFEHFNWPERGSAMVPVVQRRVHENFGSVEAFAKDHAGDEESE